MPAATEPEVLTHGPFTSATAALAGVSDSALRDGPWRQVFRDVWIHEALPDDQRTRAEAIRLVLGKHAFVCGLTAAWLYGVDARDPRWPLVWVGCPAGTRVRSREGCYTREVSLEARDLDLINGVLLTTPVRTAYDCARWLSPVEALVVAEAMVHDGLLMLDELVAYRNAHRGTRNVTRVDAMLRDLEPLSESSAHTRLRCLLLSAGLGRPAVQHLVRDTTGGFVGRLALAYPGERVAIEYDVEYDDSPHWDRRREDAHRRDALRALGWRVIVVAATDLDVPERLLGQVRAALDPAA
ncbi:MAG TPA: hypothetical protein VHB69_02060 [Mycobacteriales bacterium]|nr:hypothetical protein [Mycobacteriales bacterium]